MRKILANLRFDDILETLGRDKKTEGSTLKLVVVESIGQIRFIDLALAADTVSLLQNSVTQVLQAITEH